MTPRQRLAKIDALHARVTEKRTALFSKRQMTGKDAARAVDLQMALHRIDCLMPFHRQRRLP